MQNLDKKKLKEVKDMNTLLDEFKNMYSVSTQGKSIRGSDQDEPSSLRFNQRSPSPVCNYFTFSKKTAFDSGNDELSRQEDKKEHKKRRSKLENMKKFFKLPNNYSSHQKPEKTKPKGKKITSFNAKLKSKIKSTINKL